MRYGLPYMGSKNDLAKRIVDILPAADVLVDLFAGGCAVTHAALLSGKWKKIIANDITDAPQLFYDAIHGKYHDCDRWVSREEFYMEKDKDPFVRLLWSFGNNQKDYMYNRDLEPYKKAIHGCIFEKTTHARYMSYRRAVRLLLSLQSLESPKSLKSLERLESLDRLERLESLKSLESLQCLESLKRLERLKSLERLESLESLERLEIILMDYRKVKIPPNAVIYCDPPYRNTNGYLHDFDHAAFDEWCLRQTTPLFVSEYTLPHGECVAEWKRVGSLSQKCTNETMEKLYAFNWNKPQGVCMKQPTLF